MTVPPWLRIAIITVVGMTIVQTAAIWATCAFFYGPRLLTIHTESQGKIALGQSCEGAGDKAVASLSALLATLLGLASQPPSER